MLVLGDLAAGAGPSWLKAQTPQPQRSSKRYTIDGRSYKADVYIPGEPALAKIVLVPGVEERGKDDPRLVNFAMTFSRARFLVLVPDIPGLRALKVRTSDVQGVVDAFTYLKTEEEPAPPAQAGIGAFSYAAGPAILAALRPQISEQVDFLLAVGGYHDLNRVLVFITTGYYFYDGKWRYLTPNTYGRWTFIVSNLERLHDPGDREAFRRMANRRMADPNAPIDDLIQTLQPEGQALYQLLDNTNPSQMPELIARIPASIRADLDALSLANKELDALKAHLILIHGRDDNIIPYSESIDLAKRLPPAQTGLYIVDGLFHVDLKPGLLDNLRLWQAIRAVLKKRDQVK